MSELDYYQLRKSVVNMLIWNYGLKVINEDAIVITDERMFLDKLSKTLKKEKEELIKND